MTFRKAKNGRGSKMLVRSCHEKSWHSQGTGSPAQAGGRAGAGRLLPARGGRVLGRGREHGQPLDGRLPARGRPGGHPGQADAGKTAQADGAPGKDGARLGGQAAHALRLCQRPVDEPAAGWPDRAAPGRALQQQLPGRVAARTRAQPAKACPARQRARRACHRPLEKRGLATPAKKPGKRALTSC